MNPSSSTASALDYEDDDTGLSVARHIKDPIHNYIPISPKLSRFIDTRQFQRLRLIKQLGTTSYVWPSASHTRFEHCLGVAYLARLMATHIQRSQPELNITDRDVDCVEIAGLCHDLGHGPWSHVWDGMFIPVALKDVQWQHEMGSEMMFDALIEDLNSQLQEERRPVIPVKDQQFIKALIAGDYSRTPHEKAFLFDIVANKRNGLDVDKFDYIHRDSHMIGEPISLSLVRLVNSARVLDDQICYDIKDANHIYDICVARFKLHKSVYNHKAAKAIEYMIIDALLLADPYLKIAERVLDPKKYLRLTDDIMPFIEASEEPALAPARAIFDRIRTRQLYKCVDFKVIDWPMRHVFREHVTPKRIVQECRRIAAEATAASTSASSTAPSTPVNEKAETESTDSTEDTTEIDISDVIVDFSTMHYGMKDKNPVDSVRFYSKRRPKESMEAGPGEYSNLRPMYFAEELLRVYTKNPKYFGLVQAGYNAVLAELQASMEKQHPAGVPPSPAPVPAVDPAATPGATMVPAPTPPATEAPSTPTASTTHSRTASLTIPPPLSLVARGEGSTSSLGSASGTATATLISATTTTTAPSVTATSSVTNTPFGPNKFMAVSPYYAPASPTRSSRRPRGGGAARGTPGARGAGGGSTGGTGGRKRLRERERDDSPTGGSSGVKKRR